MVFEDFFHRRESYRLANLNFLFEFKLLEEDFLTSESRALVMGDDGGYTDYLTYKYSDFSKRIFQLAPMPGKLDTTKFIKPEAVNEETVRIKLKDLFEEELQDKELDLDQLLYEGDFKQNEDGYFFTSKRLKKLSDWIIEYNSDSSEERYLQLYIARRKIQLGKSLNENKMKKFLLLNTILALSTIINEGSFVIKIYEMYTSFTISILYLLYSCFSKFSIVKPHSSNPITASRYIICQGFKDSVREIALRYLYEFWDDSLKLSLQGKEFLCIFSSISSMSKDPSFKEYVYSSNISYDEKRINSFKILDSLLDSSKGIKYDKMRLKKHCLDAWGIPVNYYDESKVIKDGNEVKKGNKRNKTSHSSTVNNILDNSKFYESYDIHGEKGSMLLNTLCNNTNKRKSTAISNNKSNETMEEELKRKQIAKLEEIRKKSEKKGKKSTKKEDNLIGQKRSKQDQDLEIKTKYLNESLAMRSKAVVMKEVSQDVLAELQQFKSKQ